MPVLGWTYCLTVFIPEAFMILKNPKVFCKHFDNFKILIVPIGVIAGFILVTESRKRINVYIYKSSDKN